MHAQQLTIIVRSGVYPERLNLSLHEFLENIANVSLVEKLRYIQLYEADFSFFSKVHIWQRDYKLTH